MRRVQLEDSDFDVVFQDLKDLLALRLKEKGRGISISNHESLGIITEEYGELVEAIRKGDEAFDEEVEDLAIACIFHLASASFINMKTTEDYESMLEVKQPALQENLPS